MSVQLHPDVQRALDAAAIAHEVLPCDPDLADTAAFCEHYGFTLEESANTILVASKKAEPAKYAVCVVLADSHLDVNKKVCQLLGVKKASFASAEDTVRLTGMQIGGVTVFGIQGLPVYVDARLMEQQRVVMGGGNRSSKVVLDPAELVKLPGIKVVEGLAKPKE
jgi:prolyl-tRNA editing enzyme YbaK/EbsC (Cys-tRNA(Pro) deacylase)